MKDGELTMNDYLFIGEYLSHWNGAKAYRNSHPDYIGDYAAQQGYDLLREPRIRDEIERCKAAAAKNVQLTVDDIVKDIRNVLQADSRDLIEYRRGACRHCHGIDHKYMHTPAELERAIQAHMKTKAFKVMGEQFDTKGGVGYSPKKEPHPDCPECHGQGVIQAHAHDTRNLSPAAAALYSGVKVTAAGVEILTRSKDAARAAGAQYLGMNKMDLNLNHTVKAKELTDDELAAIAKGAEP